MEGIWRSVRKFRLEYSDLPTMLSNVSTMLRILALNIDGRNKTRIPTVCVILTAISSILYFYVYVSSGFWATARNAVNIGEYSDAVVVFSLNITSQIATIKLFYMMFYEEKLKVLTNKCLALDAHVRKGTRFSNNMLKSLRYVKRRGITYWLILLINGVLYVIRPLVTPGRHLAVDNFIIYGLEPMLKSPNYEIATVLMAMPVMFISFTVANVTCFFILIIGYIEAQMLSLSKEIIHIYDDAVYHFNKRTSVGNCKSKTELYRNRDKESEIINQYIKKHLVDIINKHTVNIGNLRKVEEVMRGPNAVGFLYLIIGLIAELLGGLEKTWLQVPFTMIQISADCYLGQKVIDSSIKFEQAVYACKWENFNESNKKIVLMMLQNAQKTMTLSSGGLVILSFNCLMAIIKNTYSAYNTLRSMV